MAGARVYLCYIITP